MASNNKNARDERKRNIVRIVALIACVALLLTAVLPYLSGLYR